jgi:hypothetical protein
MPWQIQTCANHKRYPKLQNTGENEMENEKLTQEMLKENLHYEPASGVLTWLETEELPEEVISNHYLYIVLNDKSFTKKRLFYFRK